MLRITIIIMMIVKLTKAYVLDLAKFKIWWFFAFISTTNVVKSYWPAVKKNNGIEYLKIAKKLEKYFKFLFN